MLMKSTCITYTEALALAKKAIKPQEATKLLLLLYISTKKKKHFESTTRKMLSFPNKSTMKLQSFSLFVVVNHSLWCHGIKIGKKQLLNELVLTYQSTCFGHEIVLECDFHARMCDGTPSWARESRAHTYQEALAFDKKAIKPQEATKIIDDFEPMHHINSAAVQW